MDYNRLKDLAEGFVGRGCLEYPDELEGALRDTATTGIVKLQWSLLCPVLHYRLEKALNYAFPSSELGDESKEISQQLLRQLDNFDNPPFTIQRLCELLLQPKKHYKKLDYYMRAIEKNLLVVGTQEPDIEWMHSPRLIPPEKPRQDEVKVNGTHTDHAEPHSPEMAPQPPPTKKDSPPTAPTSTWSNLQEVMEEQKAAKESDYDSGRSGEENRDLPSPAGGLTGRKRSRDSLELKEDKSSITVRQEADSTVNLELPPFEPPPPLFQGVNVSPIKRSRECLAGGCVDDASREVDSDSDKKGKEERESFLSSSTELVSLIAKKVAPGGISGGEGEGGGEGGGRESSETEEGGVIRKDSSVVLDKLSAEKATPSVHDVKQVPSECYEAMDTN